MSITLSEMKERALEFCNEWKEQDSEKSESQTFWNDFFSIFGITRRRVATFEKKVKIDSSNKYIDLFWKKTLVVEHKSKGKDLNCAYSQALSYFQGIKEEDLPKYVIVSDFYNFVLYDLEKNVEHKFTIDELYLKLHLFDFMTKYKTINVNEDNPVDIEAGKLIGELHYYLKKDGYNGHSLELLMVRILFCLFADDTDIWVRGNFKYYIENKTQEDGSDLGEKLNSIFDILNTPKEERQINIDENLNIFEYINGGLFEERLKTPYFNRKTRLLLLKCCNFYWANISPVVFGSIFQSSMDEKTRGNMGSYYTSEKDILKILNPLFLDEIKNNFEKHKDDKKKLKEILKTILNIKILDPACGCGNFLILAYRELRLIEIKIIHRLHELDSITKINDNNQEKIDACDKSYLNVNAMYGFEIDELPVLICKVALWLIDHQMNMKLSKEISKDYKRIPLKTSPNIKQINALRVDWNEHVDKYQISYIVGNPPFAGKDRRSKSQKYDMDLVFSGCKRYGYLDYVCAWYKKTIEYIRGTMIETVFVSTSSIIQGEQAEILWNCAMKDVKINFAHKSFKWNNGLAHNAQVYVIAISFSFNNRKEKFIYDYSIDSENPSKIICSNINIYLVNKSDFIVKSSNKALVNSMPIARIGSKPVDDNNLVFSENVKNEIIFEYPEANDFIKPFIGASEFVNGKQRWCIWINNTLDIMKIQPIKKRIENVRKFRENSKDSQTFRMHEYPHLFCARRQPENDYIVIPRHTTQNRKYIPIDIISKDIIVGDSCVAINSNDLCIMGILMSSMHMIWVKQFCGRIKNDYRYSIKLCYNTFPMPDIKDKDRIKIINLVKKIINIRKLYNKYTLNQLYNTFYMPQELLNEHKKLDKAIEKCYCKKVLKTDNEKFDVLLEHYLEYRNKKEKVLKVDV